ncbi:MAG: hypothetical protein ACR2HD_02025 [Solirubrobacteraceae bacterium]|nr:MAG: hypothetical protein DLM63_10685 [Solirubrobacterales bacterium]
MQRLDAASAIAVLVLGVGLAQACGSGGGSAGSGVQSGGSANGQGRAGVQHRQAPRLGSTVRVSAGGTTLLVTVSAVLDPLRSSGAALLPGTHAAGVVLRVRNQGPGVYDSAATSDISLLSAAGAAGPQYVPQGSCQTPLRDPLNAISAGETRSVCVGFALTSAQKPTAVRFSPNGRTALAKTWRVR